MPRPNADTNRDRMFKSQIGRQVALLIYYLTIIWFLLFGFLVLTKNLYFAALNQSHEEHKLEKAIAAYNCCCGFSYHLRAVLQTGIRRQGALPARYHSI